MSKKNALLLSIAFLAVRCSLVFASDLRYKPGELLIRFSPKTDGKQQTVSEQNRTLYSIDGGTVEFTWGAVIRQRWTPCMKGTATQSHSQAIIPEPMTNFKLLCGQLILKLC
jgi:hypothetical protein